MSGTAIVDPLVVAHIEAAAAHMALAARAMDAQNLELAAGGVEDAIGQFEAAQRRVRGNNRELLVTIQFTIRDLERARRSVEDTRTLFAMAARL